MFVFLIKLYFFFKQKTAYEMRISDWSSDVCSSDLLTFNVHNYTWTGSPLTLGGTAPTVRGAGNSTIASALAGTSGLTMSGIGQLFLTGTNTFSGGITLNSGALRVSNDAALGNLSNNILTTGNASFRIDAGSSSRTVTIGAGTTLSLSGASTGTAFYTGAGEVSVASGTTMNNDANNYTGATRLNGATQARSEEHTSALQSLMRITYDV